MGDTFSTVEEYIESFPQEVQTILREISKTIGKVMPEGEEVISYQIPVVKVDGRNVIHYAGWKKHVSLYPIPSSAELADDLGPFISGRGTVKFPLDEPIPYDLIERMAAQLLEERK
ncbi:MAG: DUF1801 domain-containing protein [Acidimicrobiia bacterium]|nr:DUF1801 domain-containing protein [Acidimicrobiia bacterium]